LARQGTAYFALESFEQALKSFHMALDMCPNEDATRAKLLNNIGVIHCFRRKRNSDALKSFTSALEIQRVWLEGPVRRESIVYDASITLENMGKIYLQRGDYDLSYFVYEEACVVSIRYYRNNSVVARWFDNAHPFPPRVCVRTYSYKPLPFEKIMMLS
jgi:tetratricopeptide (TPR) repeat protein